MTVRSRQEIANSLISRAEARGEGDKMRQTLRQLFKKTAEDFKPHAKAVFMARKQDGQARSIRALNLIAELEGLDVRYTDNAATPVAPPQILKL